MIILQQEIGLTVQEKKLYHGNRNLLHGKIETDKVSQKKRK